MPVKLLSGVELILDSQRERAKLQAVLEVVEAQAARIRGFARPNATGAGSLPAASRQKPGRGAA